MLLLIIVSTNISAAEKELLPKKDYITLQDAYKIFTEKKAVFLDARSEFAFLKERVPGSIQIQAGKTDGKLEQIKKNKTKTFIAYCYGPGCPLAEHLAIELKSYGIKNVKVFSEGWAGWSRAGYPVEKGIK